MAKKLPTGRLSRIAQMAKVGLRTGRSLLLADDGRAAAQQAAEVLGGMRGLATKAGQMLSYVDGLVPEAQRAAYEEALAKLQTQATVSAPDAVRRVIESELGEPPERLFAEFSDTPLASASIGQVHRATLHDGRAVAVKVQHPGIEAAVEADLRNAGALTPLAKLIGPASLDIDGAVGEVHKRFREELDYGLEANWQARFAQLHAHDPSIVIPAVVPERSARRVLTSEFVQGRTLAEVGALEEAQRGAYAEVLWRFVFRGNLVGQMFNADPHPGNYLFLPEGRIAFLDFGCVQPLAAAHVEHSRAMHAAAGVRDEAAFFEATRGLLQLQGGSFEAMMLDYARHTFDPLFDAPFRITRGWAADIVGKIPAIKMQMVSRDRSFRLPPPGVLMLTRLQLGFYSVLARLDAEVDYAAVERGFL